MTQQEKIQFVNDLMTQLQDEVVSNIKSCKIPKEWTGIQLRQYLADLFTNATYPMSRSDKKQYKKDILVKNL